MGSPESGSAAYSPFEVRLKQAQTSDSILAKALHLNSVLISHCRYLGVFSGQYSYRDANDSAFTLWSAQEQIHRYESSYPNHTTTIVHII